MPSPDVADESLQAFQDAVDGIHTTGETELDSFETFQVPDGLRGLEPPAPDVGLMLRRLTVLVPTLNEEAGIVKVLGDIPFHSLKKGGYAASTLVVDGNSTDKTRDLARAMGAEVFVQTRKGKGSALREVIPTLLGDFAVMLDGDGTYPSSQILEALQRLEEGADVVSGSRLSGWMETDAMSRTHQWGNRALTGLANVLYPSARTSDLCTGFWAFRVEALKQMHLTADGFELEADLLAETALQGFRYAEVPIAYGRRRGESKLTWKHGARIALTLIKKKFSRRPGPRGRWAFFGGLLDARRRGRENAGPRTP